MVNSVFLRATVILRWTVPRAQDVQDAVNRVWISGDGLEWSLVFRRVNWASWFMMDLDSSVSLSCQRGWSAIKSVCVLIKLRREKDKIIRRLAQDKQARRRVRAQVLLKHDARMARPNVADRECRLARTRPRPQRQARQAIRKIETSSEGGKKQGAARQMQTKVIKSEREAKQKPESMDADGWGDFAMQRIVGPWWERDSDQKVMPGVVCRKNKRSWCALFLVSSCLTK